ncbi:Hint domain-containing protein [Shimia sp. R11_0]|uniref:Hint domain-containing protein n=1 Tax=Shimia sp. R11_0 TaxID=2821096 RepID=UPI001AD9F64E|nr:Hint domain-containing protein [Shimia sp. R11_0]MBO9476530.1 Hint domain-containing protein [Shimia sp. R11_0]
MARITELHFPCATTAPEAVEPYVEVTLSPSEAPGDFVLSLYHPDGTVGVEIPLSQPNILVAIAPDTSARKLVLAASHFPLLNMQPDGQDRGNYTGFALTDMASGRLITFCDISIGVTRLVALDGAAQGHSSRPFAQKAPPAKRLCPPPPPARQPQRPASQPLVAQADGASGVACFAAGTRIRTKVGHQLIDTLRAGDLIWTRDNGLQPILWIGKRTLSGRFRYAPIQIAQETFGALKPHWVSPDHLLLLTGWRAELLYQEQEILVPARALVDACDVRISTCETVTYFHLAFEHPQIVSGDGVLSQCFHPDSVASRPAGASAHAEMFALFPALAAGAHVYGNTRKKSTQPKTQTSLGPILMRPQ